MAEGTISKFFADRGFGFIKQDSGGKDLFFHVSVVRDLSPEQIAPGVRVVYESESSARGPRASIVRPLAGQVKVAPVSSPTQAPVTQRQGRYRFLNPYNFVRSLEVDDPIAAPILGRATPPPHDRYTGLTGQLKCTLTTITPLFVADAEQAIADPEHPGHYNYRFFQYGGKPAIPATSLRGAIRSVYEAATNSCYAIFDADKRLSYRLQPGEALKLVPARAIEKNGTWHLELLPGATQLAIGQPPQGVQYAAWVQAYKPMRASGTVRNVPNSDYARRSTISLTGWEHNEPCQAIVEKVKHPRRGFEFWNVVALAKPGASLPRPIGSQRLIQGYVCITNQNIDNKHDERVFFYTGKNPVQIPLGNEERKRYNELVTDYQERHADEVEKRQPHPERPQGKDPGLSWFTYQRLHEENKLHDGDLVYAMLKQDARGVYLDFIVPVSVARLGYDQTIGERLDPGMSREESLSHTCQKYDALCPACRLFGWVHQDAPADTDVPVAYAGRVCFSYAQKLSGEIIQEEPLAILSTPKPTTTRFYLRPANNDRPRNDREDGQVGYDASAKQKLRGRKFYRHQGVQLSVQEYRRAGRIKNDQNRTVREIQAPDSVFEFSMNFENLTPVELGALLWSLELEGWHHRLGMAKPLGFGSVKIEIKTLEIINPETRYSSLDSGIAPRTDQKVGYIDQFKEAMATRYGKDFASLDNIRDLKALLAESPRIPVHYPRASREPDPEGRNFEWFMGNKRSGRDAGPRFELPLAVDDLEGLPLIDKRGEEIP